MVLKVYVNRTRIREARTTSTGTKASSTYPSPDVQDTIGSCVTNTQRNGAYENLDTKKYSGRKKWSQLRLNIPDRIASTRGGSIILPLIVHSMIYESSKF